MDDLVKKLVIRACQNSRENGISLCATRATKIMYLIEWEYFAWKRKPLTSLNWIYLHFGPWSSMLSDLLQKEFRAPPEDEQMGDFRRVHWVPPEFDRVDTRLPPELEGIVQRVFETFGAMTTPEIIKYVYFNTEPMQAASHRGEPLSFECTRRPLKPFNPVKALDKDIRQSLRNRLRAATQAKLAEKTEAVGDVSLELLAALSQLDSSGDFQLPEGEISIEDDVRLNITEEV